MSRKRKIPVVVVERLPVLSIKNIRSLGLLDKVERYREMPLQLRVHSGLAQSINTVRVAILLDDDHSYIRLTYDLDGEPVDYRIRLARLRSNLGRGGWLWYFLCPGSKRLARKLFLYRGRFVGIEAIKGKIYHQQVLSRRQRAHFKVIANLSKAEQIIKKNNRKYLKPYYQGAPSRPCIRAMKAKATIDRLTEFFV
ncbi:MAG: hypothetical protein H7Y42_13930 [Chitinophagaceae bacterium]|nr:hypothetical protein [Chitinophagaceae bacterium]